VIPEDGVQLVRYEDVYAFAARVEPFLVRREADHNLALGLLTELRRFPQSYPGPNYYATVEQGGEVLLVALRTPPHPLNLSHATDAPAVALVAGDLNASSFAPPRVTGPWETSLAFAEAWRSLTGQAYQRELALRIYRLERVRPPAGVPGSMRRATWDDLELLAAWIEGFMKDTHGEGDGRQARRNAERWLNSPVRAMYLWEDGRPVAMTGVGGPTPSGARVSAVYTPPSQRRRGYASALVAAASQATLESGRSFVFLFTDLANPTSNHIYQQIGYEPVCDVDEYALGAH
jgi:predicted GNAT family acetyltransferase